ncbi:MAG: thiamine phosphate synthase [Phycisphaerae bacterium]|nr:thiamine phosphate synthase [Phycisphaerae bacterium]
MDPAARMIDANLNRASEALRTLEDVARFALDSAASARALKDLRHELAATLASLPAGWLRANRDTAHDVGTEIGNDSESRRRGLADVAAAAGRRATEALRVLEETAKTVDPQIASKIERLRYRTYELAAYVEHRAPGARREQWRVCVLLTESLCRSPWRDVARAAIDGGADAIQLREKSLDAAEFASRAAWLVENARPAGVRVIVNDRADVAIVANADGVHVGQSDLRPAHIRQLCGSRLIIGRSTHDADEAIDAVADAVDYCGVGAMFPSGVKPDVVAGGPNLLRAFIAAHPNMPHLAIGGVTLENVGSLVDVGCRGIAVSSFVCAADSPGHVVARLRSALDRAWTGASR